MQIGVLSIHGSVGEHRAALERLGVEVILVKKVSQLSEVCGLIIPGGESTTMAMLMERFGLRAEIVKRFESGDLALWGTCAGAILLAKEVENESRFKPLGLIDVTVARNAYGRQVDSFETEVEFGGDADARGRVEAVFIRAPRLVRVGKRVEVVAEHEGEVVAAREGRVLVTTFHPELTEDLAVHKYFVEMCGK